MRLIIDNITLRPDEDEALLQEKIEREYDIRCSDFKIIRKALDARKKNAIVYRYRALIEITEGRDTEILLNLPEISRYHEQRNITPLKRQNDKKISIIGAGPAGLFCALRLIEAGNRVTIFDRGKPVEARMDDIKALEENGILNEESNVLFGEGGAGAYSDGKLTTGINRPEVSWVFQKLVEHGASSEILFESRPHIGTDKLSDVIKSIRDKILNSGSEIFFNDRLSDLLITDDILHGFNASKGGEIYSDITVLAIGHSARDTYSLLRNRGIALQKKGFAVGLRIEHPRELINSIQYGNSRFKNILPPADYRLAYNNKKSGRGIYTFCMCPGGHVINSSSAVGMLATNGMSFSARDSLFSNSAIVVTVRPDDLEDDPLGGIIFQEKIEKGAFDSGGGGFMSPAQRVTSFLKDTLDPLLPAVSYKPGVVPAMISEYLPEWIIDEIKNALLVFEKKMKGFISDEAVLIGAETRTSSPVRILRGEDRQSVSLKGLYPAGEGAGYAGGIVSSAVDGVRTADAILSGAG